MAKAPEVDDEVLNMLECSICIEICDIPVYNCKNGHNVCQSHIHQLTFCPVCRVPYSQGLLRNLLAEKLILKKKADDKAAGVVVEDRGQKPVTNVKFETCNGYNDRRSNPEATGLPGLQIQNQTCRYGGCTVPLRNSNSTLQAIDDHERECHFRPIRCPLEFNDCFNSQIAFTEFIQHLKHRHGVSFSNSCIAIKKFNIRGDQLVKKGSSKFFIMEEIYGQEFLVTAHHIGGNVYIWIGLHGTPEAANGFKVEMKMLSTQANSTNFIWSGTPATTRNRTVTDLLESFFNSQGNLDSTRFFRIPDDEVEKNVRFKRFWTLQIKIDPAQPISSTSQVANNFQNNNEVPRQNLAEQLSALDNDIDNALELDFTFDGVIGRPQQRVRTSVRQSDRYVSAISQLANTKRPAPPNVQQPSGASSTRRQLPPYPTPPLPRPMSDFTRDFYRTHALLADSDDDDPSPIQLEHLPIRRLPLPRPSNPNTYEGRPSARIDNNNRETELFSRSSRPQPSSSTSNSNSNSDAARRISIQPLSRVMTSTLPPPKKDTGCSVV